MATYKTPGVYIEEISKFPPSVAEVETAVPAFIGYTEKAEKKGQSLANVPTRIMSLLEYQQFFGGEQPITEVEVVVDRDNNFAVDADGISLDKRFYLYEALRMFYDNGGGKCYIVSVGKYSDDIESGDEAGAPGLRAGLKAVEKYDEPTMLLFPDAVGLPSDGEFYGLQQAALMQSARLQDRVAILDLKEQEQEWAEAVAEFRDGIGINNLKYGAAYTPWLRNSFPRGVDFPVFADNVVDKNGAAVALQNVTADSALNGLVTATERAWEDLGTIDDSLAAIRSTAPTLRDRYRAIKEAIRAAETEPVRTAALTTLLGFLAEVVSASADWLGTLNDPTDLKAYGRSTLKKALGDLVALGKNATVGELLGDPDVPATVKAAFADAFDNDEDHWLSDDEIDAVPAADDDFTNGGENDETATLEAVLRALDTHVTGAESVLGFVDQVAAAARTRAGVAQDTLYQRHPIVANIVTAIKKHLSLTPPSGTVAGVYAFVDRTRGVWKAPANVSVQAEPAEQIDYYEQEELNVDVTGGKSINAIRSFTGLGTLIWGARTLAGNDNEWRYVPVRRFFNMVEESVKKSTNWAVFEPNDANLWVKVKGMIENYLIQKWRDGALAGATPADAFYVKVGLPLTMTAEDILEGRLIIEIGMAVVRPAEFIILKFSHKMQQS